MSPKITIYSKDYCPYCHRAKALLTSKGLTFTEFDVSFDQEKLLEMIQKSSGRRTVPQIFIGDTHVGGSDELHELERAGKLDILIQEHRKSWLKHSKTNTERNNHVTS